MPGENALKKPDAAEFDLKSVSPELQAKIARRGRKVIIEYIGGATVMSKPSSLHKTGKTGQA